MQPADAEVSIFGRYTLYGAIARGGMATVHVGRLNGPAGFARTVAIKRLHPQLATDPEFVSMLVDEARLAARVHHPHVVATVDVLATGGEVLLVMDYVAGESLARLIRAAKDAGSRMPVPIAVSVMGGVLRGLHAAHEARSERGEPLGIVHRDVSPQNILVGTDGLARVLDFGVAKATGRLQTTRDGQLKGKLSYMAPEQLRSESVTRKADVYAASVVLWEALTGERLFASDSEGGLVTAVLMGKVTAPSRAVAKAKVAADDEMPALEALDAVVLRGLERDPAKRFATAREMAAALEACVTPASAVKVAEWVERVAGAELAERAARVAAIESAGASAEGVAADAVAAAELPTQASSISVSTSVGGHEGRREQKRARVVLASGAVLAVIGVALIVRSVRVGAPAPAAMASVAASATESATATGSATESAGPTPTPTPAPAPTPTPTPIPRPATRPKRAAPRPDCNPPFTYDSVGKKLYKPECL